MDHMLFIIDDDRDYLDILKKGLMDSGFNNVRVEDDPVKAAATFESGQHVDIALIDMNMPDMDGLELLEVIKRVSPNTECIMVTAVNEARIAVECLKKGAYHYLVKPVAIEELNLSINRALEKKRLLEILDIEKSARLPKLINPKPFSPIMTRSPKMLKLLKEAELHAGSDMPVLITGESGTGKELLARALHAASPRAKFSFMPINMASLTSNLFDAEFFGHTRGAFTGAERDRAGYLEHSNRGTLFLDEIGILPLEIQGKLLRVLQDGEYVKLGSSSYQRANVRIIAATNEDLDKKIANGLFRKDLFYRIRGGWLHLPPLRDRQEDIPLLANKFLQDYCRYSGNCHIANDAMALLTVYPYPGNVRELRSIIQSAANLAQGSPITQKLLPNPLRKNKTIPKGTVSLKSEKMLSLTEVEKNYIINVYEHTLKNKSKAARLLGIGLNTLRRKLESYGIK